MALTLAATNGTPAFAATDNSDGTVTVTIHEIAGVAGANSELARLGSGRGPCPRCPDAASYAVTITPSAIPQNDTLVLAAREISSDHVELGVMLVRGSAPACSREVVGSAHPPP